MDEKTMFNYHKSGPAYLDTLSNHLLTDSGTNERTNNRFCGSKFSEKWKKFLRQVQLPKQLDLKLCRLAVTISSI